MKKRIIIAKVVNETAKLMLIMLAFAWMAAGLAIGDYFIEEYTYPLWVSIPAFVSISLIERELMQFIYLLDDRITEAEKKERKKRTNKRNRMYLEKGAAEI